MSTLTKILGTLAITGLLTVGAGLMQKNKIVYTVGVSAFLVGGVGYALAKENKKDKSLY